MLVTLYYVDKADDKAAQALVIKAGGKNRGIIATPKYRALQGDIPDNALPTFAKSLVGSHFLMDRPTP